MLPILILILINSVNYFGKGINYSYEFGKDYSLILVINKEPNFENVFGMTLSTTPFMFIAQ